MRARKLAPKEAAVFPPAKAHPSHAGVGRAWSLSGEGYGLETVMKKINLMNFTITSIPLLWW